MYFKKRNSAWDFWPINESLHDSSFKYKNKQVNVNAVEIIELCGF